MVVVRGREVLEVIVHLAGVERVLLIAHGPSANSEAFGREEVEGRVVFAVYRSTTLVGGTLGACRRCLLHMLKLAVESLWTRPALPEVLTSVAREARRSWSRGLGAGLEQGDNVGSALSLGRRR